MLRNIIIHVTLILYVNMNKTLKAISKLYQKKELRFEWKKTALNMKITEDGHYKYISC